MITKPTRITTHSATLIDNIFTNNTDVPSKNGSIISDLSDHFPIYSVIATDHHPAKSRNQIIVRDINEMRIQDFKSKLVNIDWTSTKNASDTNAMYDLFIGKYTGLFDSCFPFRIIKGKALNSFRKPWITKGLLKPINQKNKLYKNYICNRSNPQLVKYKTYKNKLILLLRTAKKRYYEMQLDKSKENIKQTWRILNHVINRNKRKASSTLQLHDNGRDISNPEIIANKFCQYFTKIGPNLASKTSPPSKSFREFVNSSSPDVTKSGNGERGTGNGERGTGNGERGTGNGERGTGNGERGTGNGERGTGNGERGTGNGERGTGNGERGTGNGERETGNGERGTGVWERVYSGFPHNFQKPRAPGHEFGEKKQLFLTITPVVIKFLSNLIYVSIFNECKKRSRPPPPPPPPEEFSKEVKSMS